MLSRVADNLYWMSRYLERAEHTARLIDVNLDLMADRSQETVNQAWEKVYLGLGLPLPEQMPEAYDITQMLTFDATNDAAIVSHIAAARENARQVREQLSSEMWEQINRLYLRVKSS
ncbi:MAG: alpha-E domain-containing protein, partial [Anaerolineae bacterium]|nr:alpha-E domain-containing protein [Anaerolineae bacterium]